VSVFIADLLLGADSAPEPVSGHDFSLANYLSRPELNQGRFLFQATFFQAQSVNCLCVWSYVAWISLKFRTKAFVCALFSRKDLCAACGAPIQWYEIAQQRFANWIGGRTMTLRLVQTVRGTGDDGREYTIHGYKNGEEALISICTTDEGEEVWCRSEKPLEFWIPGRSVTIHCPEQE
jgi:hypothetical protein